MSSRAPRASRRRIRTAAVSAAAGASAAYFLDPDQGHRRRARFRDRFGARYRRSLRGVERKVRYERGRARGAWHNLRAGERIPPVDDHVLVDRVRSEVLGRLGWASDVSVDAFGSVVSLRGQMPDEASIAVLCDRVAAVPGVHRVESLLHLPGEVPPNKEAALRVTASHN
jgi:hypothetical protein